MSRSYVCHHTNGPGIPAAQVIQGEGGPHEMVPPTIYVVIHGPPGPL